MPRRFCGVPSPPLVPRSPLPPRPALPAQLQLKGGTTVEGCIYAFDKAANLIVIESTSAAGGDDKVDWRMVNAAVVEGVTVKQEPPAASPRALPAVSEEQLKARAEKLERQHEEALSKIGKGVTADAQQTFDWLSKTLPCSWDGHTIVVMDAITVKAPYHSDDCVESIGGDKMALDRVRRIIAQEKKKAGLVA